MGRCLPNSYLILWYNALFLHWFIPVVLQLHEASRKVKNKINVRAKHCICLGIEIMKDFFPVFFWSIMKSQEENQSQTKTLYHSLCISMLRLWFNIFFLHSFCFWLFMKLQQNLFLTFHEASAKKWKKSFYSIFEFLPTETIREVA